MKFADLEPPKDPASVSTGMSSLEMWYRAVREQEIDQLSIEDLCRAVRQQIFPENVLPVAASVLQIDPLSGDYDGQLLYAFAGLSVETLHRDIDVANTLRSVVNKVISDVDADEDTRSTAKRLKEMLN